MTRTSLQIEKLIGLLLIIGTLISMICVMSGGLVFLYFHGNENRQIEFVSHGAGFLINHSWSITLVKIGLFILVGTQVFRVLALVFYYLWQRDYYFTVISLFVSLVLIYSTCYPILT